MEQKKIAKPVVLICEDSKIDQELLTKCLEEEYEVLVAEDGNEGWRLLNKHESQIFVILMDLEMPLCNGYQLMERIKENPNLAAIPILVMSVEDEELASERCLELGAVDFLHKPIKQTLLKNKLKNMLQMIETNLFLREMETDKLTGLLTRRAFIYRAKQIMDLNPDMDFDILVADIQNFKHINFTYGEDKGDEVLAAVAKFIKLQMREDMCARYGADIFVCILNSADSGRLERINEHIKNVVESAPIPNLVIKSGIYQNVDKNLSVVQMCDRALLALKSIKHNHSQNIARFDGVMSQKLLRNQQYEEAFQQAIADKEFIIYYQPKYNPYTDQIVGLEALVRWNHEGRMISPGEFLPAFEENRLIIQLDEYVFRSVCSYQRRSKEQGKKIIPVSVNLSRQSMFDDKLVDKFKTIVDENGLSPADVPLEITESAAVGSLDIKPLAEAFNRAGFALHMDDFGSGSSSLNDLNVLHFDVVKIDKSLIDHIGERRGDLLLNYTIALAKELGLYVLAEGVETEEQVLFLMEQSCDAIQGYYYSKPLPSEELEIKLLKQKEKEIEEAKKADSTEELQDAKPDEPQNAFNRITTFQKILRNAKIGLWYSEQKNGAPSKLYVDDTFYEMMEIDKSLSPEQVYDFWLTRVDEAYYDELENSTKGLRDGDSFEAHYAWYHPTKGMIYIRHVGTMDHQYDDGYRISGNCQEITELVLKKIEPMDGYVHDSKIKQDILERMSEGVVMLRVLGDGIVKPEYMSESFAAMLDMEPEQLWKVYRNDSSKGIHPEDVEEVKQRLAKFMKGKRSKLELTYRLRKHSGRYIWVRNAITKTRNEAGEEKVYCVYKDITKELAEQEKLQKEYAEYLRQHYNNNDQNILLAGHCNVSRNEVLEVVDYTGAELVKKFGRKRDAFIKGISTLIVDEEERKDFLAHYQGHIERGTFSDGTTEYMKTYYLYLSETESGYYTQFKVKFALLPGSDENISIFTVTDVTKQVINEKILQNLPCMGLEDVMIVDLQRNKVLVMVEDSYAVTEGQEVDFNEKVNHYATTMLTEENGKLFLRMLNLEYLKKKLLTEPYYSFTYSLREHEKQPAKIKSMTIAMIDSRLDRACITTTDITNSVETELRHKMRLERVKEKYKQADRDRRTDFLTGLRNRQDMDFVLKEVLSGKRQQIMSMYMIDIDDFKKLNDKYGHVYGDRCLKKIGEALNTYGAENELQFYRYGGEEILGIGFGCKKTAGQIARELVQLVRDQKIAHEGTPGGYITVSLGFTTNNTDYKKMIHMADEAMYCAKQNGKNQAVCYEMME